MSENPFDELKVIMRGWLALRDEFWMKFKTPPAQLRESFYDYKLPELSCTEESALAKVVREGGTSALSSQELLALAKSRGYIAKKIKVVIDE